MRVHFTVIGNDGGGAVVVVITVAAILVVETAVLFALLFLHFILSTYIYLPISLCFFLFVTAKKRNR